MSLVGLIIALALLGVGLYWLNAKVKMEPWVKTTINVVAIVFVVIWLLKLSGLWEQIWRIRI